MDGARLEALVAPLGLTLALHTELGSTHDEATRRALAGAPDGLVVIAEAQSRGRGRFSRAWASPRGNLYASLLVRPCGDLPPADLSEPAELGALGLVTGLAALDACLAAAGAEAPIGLKWPNDLMTPRGKLCGVLNRLGADAAGRPCLLIGIGVNVNEAPRGPGLQAASLAGLIGAEVDLEAFTVTLLQRLAERRDRWRAQGARSQLDEWEARSGWIGEAVTVHRGAGEGSGPPMTGRVQGLDDQGGLRLRLTSGEEVAVDAGDVSLAR